MAGVMTRRQALRCVEEGELCGSPKLNQEKGFWECELERFGAGVWVVITVAVPIDPADKRVLVISQKVRS